MKSKSSQNWSRLALIASMVIFGTIGVFRRYIPLGSATLAMTRGLIGSLFLLFVTLVRRRKPEWTAIRKNLVRLILSGAAIGVNWILLFEAYRYTTVAVATLCYYMAPLIVVLLSPLVLREKITKRKGMGLLIALVGMILVSGIAEGNGGASLRGVLFGLGAAAFYAGVILTNQKIGDISASDRTIVQLASAAIAILPYVILRERGGFAGTTASTVLLTLVVGVVHTGVAYALYFASMSRLSAQSVALGGYIDPAVAVILSATLLAEPTTLPALIGTFLVLGGAIFGELPAREKEKRARQGIARYVPPFTWFALAFLVVAVVVRALCKTRPAWADAVNATLCHALRTVFSYATGWLPLSVAECLLLTSPILLGVVIYLAVRFFKHRERAVRYLVTLVSIVALVYALYSCMLALPYSVTPLDRRMDLDKHELSAEELRDTATWLLDAANDLSDDVFYDDDGASFMPYTFATLNAKLNEAYDRTCDEYPFICRLHSRVKPVMLSEAMSYTHLTGIYTFFTGEANVNVVFPDYSLAFTMAHEMAHQRGIIREDEANFVAFLVCLSSSDPYLNYAAYVNLYEYVIEPLYSANPVYYSEVRAKESAGVRSELVAYANFFEKYRESKASAVTDTINDAYLTMQGTEGVRSYGLVVDLAAAYYNDRVRGN